MSKNKTNTKKLTHEKCIGKLCKRKASDENGFCNRCSTYYNTLLTNSFKHYFLKNQ